MPWKGNDFQYDRDEAYAESTAGRYGDEHDQRMTELVNLENGVRKHFADKFAELAEQCPQDERAGFLRAARLLDPYSLTWEPGFERTELEGAEGAKEVTPR